MTRGIKRDSISCFSIYEAVQTLRMLVIPYEGSTATGVNRRGGFLDYPNSLTFIGTQVHHSNKESSHPFVCSSSLDEKGSVVLSLPLNHRQNSRLFFTVAHRVRIHPQPKNSLVKITPQRDAKISGDEFAPRSHAFTFLTADIGEPSRALEGSHRKISTLVKILFSNFYGISRSGQSIGDIFLRVELVRTFTILYTAR